MGERLLNFSEYAENILCIYRNFFMLGRARKFWMTLRVLLELSLIFVCAIIWLKYTCHALSDVFYVILTSVNSVLILILAIYHGRNYASFKKHLNFGYRFFIKDDNYRQNLEAKHSVFVALVVFIVLCKIIVFIYALFHPAQLTQLPAVWRYLTLLNDLLCDLRYVFEFLMLYCFLYVMYEQINLITRTLDGGNHLLDHETIIQLCGFTNQTIITEIHKWCVGYKHVRQSCKFFNTVFGFQLNFMLTIAMSFYIIFLYIITSKSVTGQLRAVGAVVYICTVFLMLYILFMLSYSAQQMQNSADVLRRRICKILIFSLSDTENYQAIKDLLRMMSTSPIRVRAIGSVPVDMTLLPSCISFFTTYTVIALQFNNVF